MTQPHPDLSSLIRAEVALYSPAATTAAVAARIGVPASSLHAWCAAPTSDGYRRPRLASLLDLLGRLGSDRATVNRARALWLASQEGGA